MKNTLRLGLLSLFALVVSKPDARAFHWNGHFFSAYVDHCGLHFRTCSPHLASAMMLGPGRYTLATPQGHGYGGYGYGCYGCGPTNYYNGTFLGPYCHGQCATAAPPGSAYAAGLVGGYGYGGFGFGYGGYGCEGGYCPTPYGGGYPAPVATAPMAAPAPAAPPASVFHQAGYMPAYPAGLQPGYAPWGYYPMNFGGR